MVVLPVPLTPTRNVTFGGAGGSLTATPDALDENTLIWAAETYLGISDAIANSGIVFNNTLFDENAASHVAVGQSYNDTMANGASLTKEALVRGGANQSLIHVDWMIGSGQLDIDGVRADGTAEPLMRQGDWAA